VRPAAELRRCVEAEYDLLDFWLAGGEGKKIFGEARKKLAEHRRKHYERELPVLGAFSHRIRR
jgi:hypothetical protein